MLCNRFAEKCAKNEGTKHMFKINTTNHAMKLRNPLKFKPINAKTARLEKSAIPKMIKHLNLKHEEQKRLQEKYLI